MWIQCYFYRYVVLRQSLWCQFSQRYSLFVLPQNGKYCSTEPGANFNMILTRYSCPFYDSNTGWEFCIYSIWRINPKSVSFSTFIFHMNYFFWTSWFLNVIYIPTSKKIILLFSTACPRRGYWTLLLLIALYWGCLTSLCYYRIILAVTEGQCRKK